jgi:dihydroflavonol-4-reductase
MTGTERGRVLVTGASGFVGSHVAEQLASAGWRVRCLVRPTSSRRWLTRAGYEFALGDVTDLHGIPEALAGCDPWSMRPGSPTPSIPTSTTR